MTGDFSVIPFFVNQFALRKMFQQELQSELRIDDNAPLFTRLSDVYVHATVFFFFSYLNSYHPQHSALGIAENKEPFSSSLYQHS